MSEDLRDQIRNNFEQKDIYELLMIWKANNRIVWSDTAFGILENILKERLRTLPPQNEPIIELEEVDRSNIVLEVWEANLLDDEDQPGLYEVEKVLRLKNNINRIAVWVIIVNIFIGLLDFQFVKAMIQGIPLSFIETIQLIPKELGTILSVGLKIAITYFPLKALVYILRILMQMEFNSRKAN